MNPYNYLLNMMKLNSGSCSVERFEYYAKEQLFLADARRRLEDAKLIYYREGRLILTEAGKQQTNQ